MTPPYMEGTVRIDGVRKGTQVVPYISKANFIYRKRVEIRAGNWYNAMLERKNNERNLCYGSECIRSLACLLRQHPRIP